MSAAWKGAMRFGPHSSTTKKLLLSEQWKKRLCFKKKKKEGFDEPEMNAASFSSLFCKALN